MKIFIQYEPSLVKYIYIYIYEKRGGDVIMTGGDFSFLLYTFLLFQLFPSIIIYYIIRKIKIFAFVI